MVNAGDLDAVVNYVDRAQIGPEGLAFAFDHTWSGIPLDRRVVRVTDATSLEHPPTLEKNGFETLRIECPEIGSLALAEIENHWVPAVRQRLLEQTGADEVACWAFSMRFSEAKVDAPRNDVSNPARRVHSDFSPAEFGDAIRHSLTIAEIGRLARGRRLKRWIGLNAWQAFSPPPYDTPLIVCDKTSLTLHDLVTGTGSAPSMPEFKLELPLYSYSAAHRWYYYPQMAPDEALVFLGIDSAERGRWRLVPHTAVDNPLSPPGAPPRCSVEMRTMALFFD